MSTLKKITYLTFRIPIISSIQSACKLGKSDATVNYTKQVAHDIYGTYKDQDIIGKRSAEEIKNRKARKQNYIAEQEKVYASLDEDLCKKMVKKYTYMTFLFFFFFIYQCILVFQNPIAEQGLVCFIASQLTLLFWYKLCLFKYRKRLPLYKCILGIFRPSVMRNHKQSIEA